MQNVEKIIFNKMNEFTKSQWNLQNSVYQNRNFTEIETEVA